MRCTESFWWNTVDDVRTQKLNYLAAEEQSFIPTISQEDVTEYQAIYQRKYNKEISFDEAQDQGLKLIMLIEIIIKPIVLVNPIISSKNNKTNENSKDEEYCCDKR